MKRTQPRLGLVVMGVIIGFLLAVAVGLVVAARDAYKTGVGAKIVVPSGSNFDYQRCVDNCYEAFEKCQEPLYPAYLECSKVPFFPDGSGNCYTPDGQFYSCDVDRFGRLVERLQGCESIYNLGDLQCDNTRDACYKDCNTLYDVITAVSPSPRLK